MFFDVGSAEFLPPWPTIAPNMPASNDEDRDNLVPWPKTYAGPVKKR